MKKVRRKLNRIGALALAVVLMGTSIDFPVIAAGNCEHHTEHTAECGYKAAVEGADCTHEHGDECYSEEKNCVHRHDGECGYVEAVEGADCNHSHDENCGENGEECTHTEHTSDCGYKEPQEGSECNHECSEESGCIKTKENCNHTHDESCGYKAAVEGTPCIFACDDCASEESGQEDEEENDTCICEEKCTADAVNEECPVCSLEEADLALCAGEAVEEEEETDTCICENKCTAEAVNEECPVCSLEEADLTLCVGEESIICTCGTDDPAFHATNCPAYIAPENPQCICAEKCTEDTLNVWCDVCGMQGVSACHGEDTAVAYEIVANGTCGAEGNENSVTWSLDSDGTLTISGSGAMWDYSTANIGSKKRAPWFEHKDNITTVIIEEGVTTIGTYAFWRCEQLTEITISATVTTIGNSAFMLCESLIQITIPQSVTSIGEFAFSGCRSLTSVTLPNSISTIQQNTFANCTSLTSITIPEGVTTIGPCAFCDCTSLNSITIPEGVTTIGDLAFGGCTSLETIVIPSSVTTIGANVFDEVPGVSSEDGFLIINGILMKYTGDAANVEIPSGVTKINQRAFEHNQSIVTVKIPSGVTTLGNNAFSNCDSLVSVELPETLISMESSFIYCDGLKEITIPNGMKTIGRYAFGECTSLEKVTIPNSVTEIGDYAFENIAADATINAPCSWNENPLYTFADGITVNIPVHQYLTYSVNDEGNVINNECSNCGKVGGTLTINAEGGIYDGTTKYGATVEKTGTLENKEVTVNYYQGVTFIGTDAPINAGTYTAKITYEDVTASCQFNITKAEITSITDFGVVAPVAGETPQSSVAAGTGYTAEIRWQPDDTSYAPNTVYTATVILTADTNHSFADSITVSGWDKSVDADKLVFTKEFDATGKLECDVIVPTANILTYNGSAQELVTAGTVPDGCEMQYKLGDDGTFSDEIPTATDANTYKVYWKVVGNDTYNDIDNGDYVEVTISKATPTRDMFTATPSSELVYDGSEKSIIVTTDKEGMGTFTVSYDGSNYSTQFVEAAWYIVDLHIEEGDNYNAVDTLSLGVFEIKKANSAISAAPTPIAELVYDGTAHNLINEGTATGGEMQYSLDGTNYLSAIPTGTDAKTYTVWYKVVGDKNHNDTEPEKDKVTIAPKTVEISSVTAINREFDGTNTVEISEVIIEGILDEDEDKVSVSATAAIDSINAGEYIIVDLSNITLTGSAASNYSIATSVENVPLTTAVTISKADAPTLPSGSKAYVYSIGYEGESVSITGLPTNCGEVEYSLLSVSSDMFENLSVDSRSGKITYDVKALDNYTEDLQSIISVNVMMENYKTAIYTLTITRTEKIPQNISAEDITFTYGDADATISVTGAKTELSYEVVEDSNDNGYVVTVDANGKVSIENAGTAIIKITAVASDTYAESECEISVTVNKRPVNVPAKDSTVYTYTGKEQTYSIASSPYYTIGNATHTDAGKYIVSVTLNDNYEWNGNLPVYEFEIKPAAVTITANSYSVKEGDELPDFGYTVNGLVNGETLPITVSVTCEASDTSVAGTYDITVTGTTSEGNYTYTYKTGVLAITHDIELRNVKEATCTAGGYSGDKYCTVCGETIESGTATEPLGHNYVSKVTKQPTTTEEGVMTYTCSRCGDSYTKPISKLPSSGGDSDDDSGNGETGGSSGGGSTNDTPATETPTPQAPTGGTTAPTTPQPGGKTPVAEPDEETDNPEPFIKGEDGKEGWDVIRDEVEDAEEGDTVTVDMNGTTVVPGDVFDNIKGKDVTVVFDLGNGVAWSVNGKDITSDNVGDIDFEVKVGADANDSIPVEVRNAVTGESYFVNISLAYDGEFGFKAVLSVNLEKENAGLYANLFYYNPQTNEMEFICSDVIAEDGTAELIFTHASEYTIVIDKVAMDAPASSEEGVLPEIGLEAEEDNSSDATNVSDPLEFGSDDNNSAWWIILLVALLAVAGVAGFVVYSKKKKSE